MKRKFPKNSPRYSAGGFELKEGTGPITGMQSCGNFLEVYKRDKTFRVQTPESLDPDETNENIPWVATPVADVGSANPIVSRIFMQASDVLSAAIFENTVDKDSLRLAMHTIKETLLGCEKIFDKLYSETEAIREQIEKKGLELQRGRTLNPFPHVPELDQQAAAFLIQAKRALVQIGTLPKYFYDIPSRGANFHKIESQLRQDPSASDELADFVASVADEIQRIVYLRNFQEHPGEKSTTVTNYTLTPDVSILAPQWTLSGEESRFVTEDMYDIVVYILLLAESFFLHLVQHNLSRKFPYIIVQTREEDVDENCPIMFRLEIDPSAFAKK